MRAYVHNPEPIWLIVRPCGCICGYIRCEPGAVLPHKLREMEMARGNFVIESDLLEPPRLKDCPHRGIGTQEPLPGLAPLVNKAKVKR